MQSEKGLSDTDTDTERHLGFINYIENLDTEGLSDMLNSRAIPSMLASMRRHRIKDFSDVAVRLWTVDMLLDGLKGSTVKRYSRAMHTLYKKWVLCLDTVSDEDPFSISLTSCNSGSSVNRLKEIYKNLDVAERFTKLSVKQNSPAFLFNKAFQFLLFDPFASLRDIVTLKFGDKIPDCPHLEDIVTSLRDVPQAKYVFPLKQGKRREPAIVKDLLMELHATGQRAGMKFNGSFSRESITSLWIAAALRENVAYEEIRGLIPIMPDTFSFLSLIDPVEVSESRKIEILNIVAFSITDKNPGWFVLRMRSGVTPDRIKERLKEKDSPLQRQIQYYYPMRKIKKLEKKKVVSIETPVIPGILFIRIPHDSVAPLIGIIGDLAWCYRTTANPTSPYSVIPQAEMRLFQRSVGAFTEDVEMDIVSELPPLNVGDEVIIENGSHLDGQVATIRAVRSIDGTLTYTLRLSDSAFIKWKDVSLPAYHLSKLSTE